MVIPLLSRLILIRSKLGMMRGSSMVLTLLHNDSLTVAALGLHGNRNCQRVAAEQRQPNRQ